MADLALVPRGDSWTIAGGTRATETTGYSSDAQPGDYVLLIGSVDYLAAASNPGAPACPTVSSWSQLAAQADPASGSTIESIRAWLGRITTAPSDDASRTISVPQTGSSGLHLAARAYYGGSSDAVIAQDGSSAGIVDRSTPYTFPTITPAGTRDLLVCAFGAVQFSGTLAYGVPTGMDEGPAYYVNTYSGLQVATQQLSAAAATGTRDLTSNIATLSGGAGVRFLLRSQGTAPVVPSGPEPGRAMLAY